MAPRLTDIIAQFDGSADFAEWVKKLEMVAKMQKIEDLACFLPLFLTGKAFSVYEGLSESDKSDYNCMKKKLCKAFSLDSFTAYESFITRRYNPGESVDVYLSDLNRLAGLTGGRVDDFIKAAFISGLPPEMSGQLKAASALDQMTLAEVAERARTISFDTALPALVAREGTKPGRRPLRCFTCDQEGHTTRTCPDKKSKRRCFLCGEQGHFVAQCTQKTEPKNE